MQVRQLHQTGKLHHKYFPITSQEEVFVSLY